jgi:hypothetical protein
MPSWSVSSPSLVIIRWHTAVTNIKAPLSRTGVKCADFLLVFGMSQ